ncbi:MAG: LamG-like jellyroll fold domain-containing protein, partial [Gammaproteobacteria bacterium]
NQIAEFMNEPVNGEDNLVAWYKLDETSGTTVTDSSGNGRNGTFNGDINFTTPIVDFAGDTIAITGVTLSDADASGNVTATFSVTAGTLTVNTGVANGISAATNNGTATVTVTDSVAAIRATLNASDGLSFSPPANATGIYDLTVNINDGTANTSGTHKITVEPQALEMGGALQLNGANQYVTIADDPALDLTTNWTIEFWAYVAAGAHGNIISRDAPGVDQTGGYNIAINGTTLSYETNNIDGHNFTNVLSTDAWNHVSLAFDNGILRLYVNGQSQGSGVATAPSDIATPLLIGRRGFDNTADFEGLLDEIRLWNVTRTAEQVESHFERTLSGDESGLVAYYRADEAGGRQLTDLTGNGLNGELINGTGVDGSGFVNILGRALSLDGVDDYVSVADHNDLDLAGAFTLEAWVYLDDISGECMILDKPAGLNTNVTNYRLFQRDGRIGLYSSAGGESNEAGASLVAGQWTHIVAVFDGVNTHFYANGVDVGGGGVWSHNGVNDGALFIGRSAWGVNADGRVDEVRIWSTARTADEIAANYNQALRGDETGLVAYYDFADGTAVDRAGTAQDGSLENGASVVTTAHALTSEEVEVTRNSSVSGFVDSQDDGTKSYAQASAPGNGTLTLDTASGHWVYTPNGNYSGVDRFAITYTDSDGGGVATRHYDVEVNTPTSPDSADVRTGSSQAAVFDGVDDYLTRGTHDTGFDLPFYTLEAWIKPESLTGDGVIMSNMNLGLDQGFWLDIEEATGNLRLYTGSVDPSDDIHVTSTTDFSTALGQWTHVAASYDGISARIYVNGVLQNTEDRTFGTPDLDRVTYDSGYFFTIGNTSDTAAGSSDNRWFHGSIDNVRVWDHKRPDADIARDYDKVLSGSEDGLVALYQMDDAGGTMVDATGNGRDLSQSGGVGQENLLVNVQVGAGTDYRGLVLGTDGSEADALSYTLNTGPTHTSGSNGNFSLDSDGTFLYHPDDLYTGADSFTVDISDGTDTYTQTISLTVA